MELISDLFSLYNISSVFGLPIAISGLIFLVFYLVAYCRVFYKIGIKPYKALIPFYNDFVIFRALNMLYIVPIIYTGCRAFSVLIDPFFPIPVLSLIINFTGLITYVIIMIKKSIRLSDYFGKSQAFKFGLIFLHPVFLLILAFGRSRCLKDEAKEVNDENTQ